MMTDEHHQQRLLAFERIERYRFAGNYIGKLELRGFRAQLEHGGSGCSHCVRFSITARRAVILSSIRRTGARLNRLMSSPSMSPQNGRTIYTHCWRRWPAARL